MIRKNQILLIIFVLLISFSSVGAMEKCLICHGKTDISKTEETGRVVSLYVDTTVLVRSVHISKECTDCHNDINEIPHKNVRKVNCRRCHYSGNPVGAPEGVLYDQYEHSVHGTEVLRGNEKAPVCQDCHGNHNIFSHKSPESKFYWQNISETCGQCHLEIYTSYKESVHGTASAQGNSDSPVCSSCHGEHNIKKHDDTESKVSTFHISETCSECHGEKGVVNKYGVKTDRMATYERSFHGIAQKMENKLVANCASCHDYHDIRAENDPKSSVYPDNIPVTCGKEGCHPGATAQFATGQIHVDPKSEESGIIYYTSKFFLILTVSTLCGLFLFILLDLFRRAKNARQKR